MCIISTSEGNKRGRRSSRGTRSRGDRTPKAIAKFVPNNTIEFAEDPDFGIIESIIGHRYAMGGEQPVIQFPAGRGLEGIAVVTAVNVAGFGDGSGHGIRCGGQCQGGQ